MLLTEADIAVFSVCSAAYVAGPASVGAAATVAASATLIAVVATRFAAWTAAPAAAETPRQAGKKPISTLGLPGPGVKTGGSGCITLSKILAAGPVGIQFF